MNKPYIRMTELPVSVERALAEMPTEALVELYNDRIKPRNRALAFSDNSTPVQAIARQLGNMPTVKQLDQLIKEIVRYGTKRRARSLDDGTPGVLQQSSPQATTAVFKPRRSRGSRP